MTTWRKDIKVMVLKTDYKILKYYESKKINVVLSINFDGNHYIKFPGQILPFVKIDEIIISPKTKDFLLKDVAEDKLFRVRLELI